MRKEVRKNIMSKATMEEKQEEKERTEKGESRELAPSGRETWLSPFREMERIFNEVMGGRKRPFWPSWSVLEEVAAPAVDMFEEKNHIVLKAEMPGMKKEDIEVNISDHMVTISGEKKKEEKVERKDYYRVERSSGYFRRSFTLPENAETGRSKAKFQDGVLEIRIPKSEEAKEKKQKVQIE